jgi:AraC family transcriptional regulator
MLEYLAWGSRTYGDQPVVVTVRHRWEFQAVVTGRCAPVFVDQPEPPLRSHRLWIFSPACAHGWTSEPGQRCEVAVAQFSDVPDELREWMGEHEQVEVELTPRQARRFVRIVRSLADDYLRFDAVSRLRAERAMLDIAMLAIEASPQRLPAQVQTHAQQTVALALAWYEENMEQGPTVAQVARAVHVSASHLRRLFAATGRGSPLAAMRDVQLARARELLVRTDAPVKQIALTCGFSGPSVFSRVFSSMMRISPVQWRARRRAGQPPP